MAIQVGDKIPSVKLQHMTQGGPAEISTDEIFAGKKVVLFALPGAFTPTCSAKHLPGFVEQAAAIRDKGVGAIGCTAVNDVFVMNAWGKASGSPDIDMLADGNGEFVKALGLTLDASAFGMGSRGQRFALVANDGVVEQVFVEAPGEFRVSAAEHVLGAL
jgi:peroxiredoxin